jgi:predicted alpha/beta-fold hydrolase
VKKILSATYLSDFDKVACTAMYGFKSEQEYADALSAVIDDRVDIPFLVLQPKDDPLHSVSDIGTSDDIQQTMSSK